MVAASECFCNFCLLLLFISLGIVIRIPKFMFPPPPSTLIPLCRFYGLTKSVRSLCPAPLVTPPGRGATPRYPSPFAANLIAGPYTDQAPGERCHSRNRKHLGPYMGQPWMKPRTEAVAGHRVPLTLWSETELGRKSPASSVPGLSGERSQLHIDSPCHTNPFPAGRERRSA